MWLFKYDFFPHVKHTMRSTLSVRSSSCLAHALSFVLFVQCFRHCNPGVLHIQLQEHNVSLSLSCPRCFGHCTLFPLRLHGCFFHGNNPGTHPHSHVHARINHTGSFFSHVHQNESVPVYTSVCTVTQWLQATVGAFHTVCLRSCVFV